MTVNVPDRPCEAADADNPPSDRTGLSPEPPGQVRTNDDRTRWVATGRIEVASEDHGNAHQ